MGMVVIEKPKVDYLEWIDASNSAIFEVETMAAYKEVSKSVNFVLLPENMFEDDHFLDCFIESEESYIETCIAEYYEEYSPLEPHEQIEELQMAYYDGEIGEGMNLFSDYERVFNRFQLFYVKHSTLFPKHVDDSHGVYEWINSPLQEVW